MSHSASYELVVGLEVHVQLDTESKIFSSDCTAFGVAANRNVSSITLAHPGTLPKLNAAVIDMAIKMGLACNSSITRNFGFDRKNYFYPDLPKGYQLTQDRAPICVGGSIKTKQKNGVDTPIRLHKIHLEEDAGKSMHDGDAVKSKIDFNRAGVPLIEIVTEPDIRSSDEAVGILAEIRRLVRYLGISNANMEEGSMRCDANISIRPLGSKALGSKVEIKNMNSLRNVSRAIEYEFHRQSQMKEKDLPIVSETRTFNAENGTTSGMRMKEELNDYRYFPEPDLSVVELTEEYIQNVRSTMPLLPEQLVHIFRNEYGLSEYDAGVLVEEQSLALFALELIKTSEHVKAVANWLMGPVKSYLNLNNSTIDQFPLKKETLLELIHIVESGKVSHSAAKQHIFPYLLDHPNSSASEAIQTLDLQQDSSEENIKAEIEKVLQALPEKVQAYKGGKKGLIGLFMGEVMKQTKGKIDPQVANRLLRESLETIA